MKRMLAVGAAMAVCLAFCTPVRQDNYAVVGAYFDTALDAERYVVALDACRGSQAVPDGPGDQPADHVARVSARR